MQKLNKSLKLIKKSAYQVQPPITPYTIQIVRRFNAYFFFFGCKDCSLLFEGKTIVVKNIIKIIKVFLICRKVQWTKKK